ncbi:MAG: hypothetical protein R3B96_19760 [Pirellulaceae bacterium]
MQTFSPDHMALQAARRHDYLEFVEHELPNRAQLQFPPVGSLARFVVRAESEDVAEGFAQYLRERIQEEIAKQLDTSGARFRIVGPAPCPIEKLRNNFRFHLLLQGLDRQPLQTVIRAVMERLENPAQVQWVVDVDPLDLL